MTRFPDDMTLARARDLLRSQAEEGATCPCCTQYVKVYYRSIHAAMASGLIKLYRRSPHGTFHEIKEFMTHNELGDFAKLAYWDLAQEQPSMRLDGSTRTGWWKITPLGIDFVEGRATVPKHARVYNGRLLNLTGKRVGIKERLGKTFNYAELMGHEPELKAEQIRTDVSPAPVQESGWDVIGGSLFDPSEARQPPRGAYDDIEDAA